MELIFPPSKDGAEDAVGPGPVVALGYAENDEPELDELPTMPRTNGQRILAALDDGPLSEADLLDALDNDGGKAVKRGSIRTTISNLRRDGQLAPPDATGLISLPNKTVPRTSSAHPRPPRRPGREGGVVRPRPCHRSGPPARSPNPPPPRCVRRPDRPTGGRSSQGCVRWR